MKIDYTDGREQTKEIVNAMRKIYNDDDNVIVKMGLLSIMSDDIEDLELEFKPDSDEYKHLESLFVETNNKYIELSNKYTELQSKYELLQDEQLSLIDSQLELLASIT